MQSFRSNASYPPNLTIPAPLTPRTMNNSTMSMPPPMTLPPGSSAGGYHTFSYPPPQNSMIQLQRPGNMQW
jgi:hypothetical protein